MISTTQLQHIIAKLLRSGNRQKIIKIVDKLHISDIQEIMLTLKPAEQKEFLEVLFEMRQAGKTLLRLPKPLSQELLERFSDQKLLSMLRRLSARESTSLLRFVSEERSQKLLLQLETEKSSTLSELLLHPEDSAAELMSTTFFAMQKDTRVAEALLYPRTMKREVAAHYLYVIDETGILVGVLPIHELLMVDPERSLSDIMLRDVIRIPLEASKHEIAEYFNRFNLLALPVVDDRGVLQGIISIDNIIDVIQDEATEEMYKIAGLNRDDRVFVKPVQSVKKRLPWLFINILTALAGATVVDFFQGTIDAMITLVVFMPVIAGLGGNTGAQTLTVIVRGLALGEVQLSAARRIVVKELVVGLINGIVIGCMVGLVALVWKGSVVLGLIVAMAMITNLFMASLIGSLVPLTLKRLGFDPAIGSNIFVTATTDMCGFFCYLGLATLFIAYLI